MSAITAYSRDSIGGVGYEPPATTTAAANDDEAVRVETSSRQHSISELYLPDGQRILTAAPSTTDGYPLHMNHVYVIMTAGTHFQAIIFTRMYGYIIETSKKFTSNLLLRIFAVHINNRVLFLTHIIRSLPPEILSIIVKYVPPMHILHDAHLTLTRRVQRDGSSDATKLLEIGDALPKAR